MPTLATDVLAAHLCMLERRQWSSILTSIESVVDRRLSPTSQVAIGRPSTLRPWVVYSHRQVSADFFAGIPVVRNHSVRMG